VVNLQAHGPAANGSIALAGGGTLLEVDPQDPGGFTEKIRDLLEHDLKCQPDR